MTGTIGLAAGTAFAQALTAVGFLLLARTLPTNRLGVFASAYALSTFAAAVIDFGSSAAETRRLSVEPDIRRFRAWLVRRSALSALGLPVTFLAIRLSWPHDVGSAGAAMLAIQTFGMVFGGGVLAAVRVFRTPVLHGWAIALGNVLFLASCVVSNGDEILTPCLGAAGSWAVTGAVGLAVLRGIEEPGQTSPQRPASSPWSEAAPFGVFALATNAYMLLVPITSLVAGSDAAGQLAAVYRWSQPILLISLSYSAYMFPRWSRCKSYSDLAIVLRRGAPLLTASCAVAGAIVAVAPWLVEKLIGDAYRGSAHVLQLLVLATIPAVVGQPVGNALQAMKDDRFVARAGIATAGLSLLITAGLARPLGATASGIALAATAMIFATMCLHRLTSHVRAESSQTSSGVQA